jgi:hypothetical protein
MMITQPSGDMRGQYKDYLASVKSLGDVSDKVDISISKMMEASHIYFADWENQIATINDSALKKLSQDRKQQAVNNLAEVQKSIDQMRAACRPLTKDLNDIGTYLGNNLTADGLTAMKPRLDAIKLEAVSVREAMAGSITALNKFSTTLATPSK